ncbi:hypothetical protein PIB30_062432 [Stylosanthes scabra]|uniref:Putative plant transposon protein domain-containing protein n=1 Tax=Stylosanthes scabra TaxID=79078 RepID=A0ABU6YNN8_9FABA|nr:hypothetical protein [Stylosanthes scabra]
MYNLLVRINVTMVREFYANFSSTEQDAIFLRGVKIPCTEDAIRRHLGIRINLPDPGVDDAFEAVVKVYKEGNLNMTDVFRVIRREDTNWADDPVVDTIPNPLDHAILNSHASAWHKVIMANVDPKTHGTTFDMSHALLIYVLMTEGVVSLPRIMRDILLTHPMKHSRHLLPYPRCTAPTETGRGSDPGSVEEEWYHLGIHHKINRKRSSSHQQPPQPPLPPLSILWSLLCTRL